MLLDPQNLSNNIEREILGFTASSIQVSRNPETSRNQWKPENLFCTNCRREANLKAKLDNSDYALGDHAREEDITVEFIKRKHLVMFYGVTIRREMNQEAKNDIQ